MLYSEARQGRTFVIRLQDGEIIHETIERFAREQNVLAAVLTFVGGADTGGCLVTGPVEGRMPPPVKPVITTLEGVHEVTGTGTLFPNKAGHPVLHAHLACGRGPHTITGCIRTGVRCWHVLEVIMTELLDCHARRLPDEATGFELLHCQPDAF